MSKLYSSLAEQRKRLKFELWTRRRDKPSNPRAEPLPHCDYCGSRLGWNDCVMHHVIIRRGVVQGWPPDQRGKIDCEENCQLLHVGKCHERAHAEPRRMVAIQIRRYGRQRLQAWIDTLPFKVPFYWDRGLTDDEITKYQNGRQKANL